MEKLRVQNWLGDIVSYPRVVVEPETVEDIVSILQDTEKYPSPVRAVGSNHSTTACGVADNGTLVIMRKMNRIMRIDSDSVTVQAGALYIDVAQELRKYNLQFYVNAEIGTLTTGSAACCATKKSSMPDEYGQMSSYASVIKMVTPSGELIEVTEEQPELLQAMRSSYGLLGIIYEVTFKVKPLQSMMLYHSSYSLDSFHKQLPALKARGDAMMMYVDPFTDLITVEFRRYRPDEDPQKATSWQMKLRNFIWSRVAPYFSNIVTKYIPSKAVRYFLINRFNQVVIFFAVRAIRGKNILAPDQMIRFAEVPGNTKFTFSIWAFQEEEYPRVQRAYFEFCREYYRSTGYRFNMMGEAYRINADTSALFSYSFDGTVMTLDPVSTGEAGWEEFLVAYNEFCSQNGGVPVFSQCKLITRAQVEKAFGDRLNTFEHYRKRFDPADRLLNEYFRQLLKEPSAKEVERTI